MQCHLLYQDVKATYEGQAEILTETDQFRKSSAILIGRTGTCPVKAMHKYLHQTSGKPSKPLFTLYNGKFLTRHDV